MSTGPWQERVRRAAQELRPAEQGVRILRGVAWPEEVKARFLAGGGRELPRVEYRPFDARPAVAAVAEARRHVDGDARCRAWLTRLADAIETSALMLAARGTPAFREHGAALYGEPTDERHGPGTSALDLARAAEGLWQSVRGLDLGQPAAACHRADGVAAEVRRAVGVQFGADAPEVAVVEHLSANALAGPRAIRIRRDACFSDQDVMQLVQHEAFVHVCTSLNGRRQDALPVLAAGHAGTTRTQEGLAVFAEFLSGCMDPDRFRRLADRVLAIQMAIEGADFRDVFRFFRESGVADEQAFEHARRVFRGGVLTGGAPFMKDVVYLHGLLGVTDFLRALVARGRTDALLLLFCGKLGIQDVPALAHLAAAGLVRPPRHLPPWIRDRRFLVTYLALGRFLGPRVDPGSAARTEELVAATVPVPGFGEREEVVA